MVRLSVQDLLGACIVYQSNKKFILFFKVFVALLLFYSTLLYWSAFHSRSYSNLTQINYMQVLPTIVKLFASNDRAIRVGLLQHIDQYGESLSAQIVDEQVCGQ